MEIAHCDSCGCKISDDRSKLTRSADGRIYCAKCAPLQSNKLAPSSSLNRLGADEPTGEYAPISAPAPAQSVTKFYFCETCGKRITDAQILEGLGRDKKLKGVFCATCAVGVQTMEFEAISEAEVRKPIRKSSGQVLPSKHDEPLDHGSPIKKSRAGITPARRLESHVPQVSAHPRPARQKGNRPLIAALAVMLILAIPSALLLISHRTDAKDIRTAIAPTSQNTHTAVGPIKEAVVPPPTPTVESKIPTTPVSSTDPNPNPESLPKEGIEKREPLDKGESRAPVEPASSVTPAQTIIEIPPSPAVTDQPKAVADAPSPANLVKPAAPASVSRVAYTEYLSKLMSDASEFKSVDAASLLARSERDAAMEPFKAQLAEDHRALTWLQEIENAVEAGAKKLVDADDFSMAMGTTTFRVGRRGAYKVNAVKDGTIELTSSGVVLPVKVDRLAAETRFRLAAMGLEPGERQARTVFMELATQWNHLTPARLAQLSTFIQKLAADPGSAADAALLTRIVEAARNSQLEVDAEKAWSEAGRAAKAEDWKRVLQLLNGLEKDFAATKILLSHAQDLQALRDRATAAGTALPAENLVFWLRADAGVTKDANRAVSAWADQSPAHAAFTQKEAGKQPLWVENVLNGKPVLRFNGETSFLTTDLTNLEGTGFTIAAVVKGSAYNSLVYMNVPGKVEFTYTYTYNDNFFLTYSRIPSGLVANEWNVGLATYIPDTKDGVVTYRNMKKIDSQDSKSERLANGLMRICGDGKSSPMDIAEVLMYRVSLGTAQRQQIETYLSNKYGVGK